MAVVTGTRFGFTDPANVAIDMSDTLAMISPFDVPLLQLIGKDSLKTPCLSTKHEWLEDELRPLDSTVKDTGLNNTTDPVTFAVPAGEGKWFRINDILIVEQEQLRVTLVATDDLTVARGFGGSAIVAHATANLPLAMISNVNVQDAAQGASRTTTKTGLFNYTQIYEDTIVVTSTAQAIKKYVESNEMSGQLMRALRTAWIQYERLLILGRKVAPSSGVASGMDGILVRITSNAYAKGGVLLTEEFILQAMADCYKAGGQIDTIVLNSFQKRQANKFLDSMRMTNRTDRIAGAIVDTYSSDFGTADILLDRNMPTDTVLLIQKERIGFGPLTDHALTATPQPTSTVLKSAVQIMGQYTSEVRNQSAHAKITGLAIA